VITIKFNPKEDIAGSLLLEARDLNNPLALAVKLREGKDSRSVYLRTAFSPELQQKLAEFDPEQPLSGQLLDLLINELNLVLAHAPFYQKQRFRGMSWSKNREKLMKSLVKHADELVNHLSDLKPDDPMKNEGLFAFNRLLMEEIYPDEIDTSRKAEWCAWNLLASSEQDKVIAAWENWKIERQKWKKTHSESFPGFHPATEDDVWKGFRDWLKTNVFFNKCAYCEGKITGYPGHTEHFRPKSRVRRIELDGDKSEIVNILEEDSEEIQHPGYFWLAYHWQNLLPSCEYCNGNEGKLDVFPVEHTNIGVKRLTLEETEGLTSRIIQSKTDPEVFYLEPDDLDRLEGRLLLHPYYDNPEEHITFEDTGTSKVWEDSPKGKWSRKVFDLDETTKLEARRTQQRTARKLYVNLLNSLDNDDVADLVRLREEAERFMQRYYKGPETYAAAVFDYIHWYCARTRLDPVSLLGERRNKSADL
jgi:hypothetical protein